MSEQENEQGAEVGHPITNMLLRQDTGAMEAGPNAGPDLDQLEAEFIGAMDTAMKLAVKFQQAIETTVDCEDRESRVSDKLDQLFAFHTGFEA